MSVLLCGTGTSRGIAIGPVHIVHNHNVPGPTFYALKPSQLADEIARFKRAVRQGDEHLRSISKEIPSDAPTDVASFIDSHLLMLNDSSLANGVINIIKTKCCNAEWALAQYREEIIAVFNRMHDAYLKTRGDDISHVVQLIQRSLHESPTRGPSLAPKVGQSIIVADDLTPADTILLQNQRIAAFVTELGGPTSHTAILARSLGIPAIVAVHRACSLLHEGEQVIIDGDSGMVLADPGKSLLAHYSKRRKADKERKRKLSNLLKKKSRTLDKVDIKLLANIELVEDLRLLKAGGADGVGLYRTEFLYLERHHEADEEEHLHAYRKVLKAMNDKPVVIRTLDIGAEKEFDAGYTGPLVLNPALGLRAIRRSLKQPQTFLRQLRAILRVSNEGPAQILLPMITSITELNQVLSLLEFAKQQLRKANKPFNENIPVGGMIEVPAAALHVKAFAEKLDFISIGTNDLIQYTLALDRIDEEVNYLYDPLHPGVLRLIEMIIDSANRIGIPVAMCGEMAGDPTYTRLLLGLGLREFSAHPSTLAEIKEIIINSDISKLKRKSRRIVRMTDPRKILAAVNGL